MCGDAEVRVFWDLNMCGCGVAEAEEVQASCIAPNIVHALRSSGFLGPVSIHAYGNTRSLSNHHFLRSLLATGVDLHHVPGAMKDLSNYLLLDLLLWMKENSPPAHMLLISGDKEYSSIMHKLHMRGYKILLAHPDGDISPDLLSAASRVWAWDSMMKGTEMCGVSPKIDNLLHSKCILTRSLNYTEPQFSSSQDVQAELDAKSDHLSHEPKKKSQNIPKKVVKQVIDIIRLKPSGFTLAAFRRQLGRSNVVLDKDFYGCKDLLSFLLSVPNLKASLVWTSDKTRTYLFTEDLTRSTGIINDNEGTISASCDHSKESFSPKHMMVQVEEETKPYLGTRVESVSGFQQLDNRSANKEHRKENTAEKVTSIGFSIDGNAAKSPGILSNRKNAISNAWEKALSNFSSMIKFLQFVGLKSVRTEIGISETALVSKAIESKLKNQDVDMEACISSATSQTRKGEGKQKTTAQKVSSKEIPKGEGFEIPQRVMHDDVKPRIDCTTAGCLQENSDILGNGVEQRFPKRESSSKLQGKERGLQNEVDTTSPFLQAGEYAILKEALKDTGLTNQLCEDVISYLLNEGIRTSFTRATTMDEVLKFLIESNLEGIAQLRYEELVQLAKIFHDRIVMQIQNLSQCNSQSKPMHKESLITALLATFNDETLDFENHMGRIGCKVKEDGCKALLSDKIVLSKEQDLGKDISKMSKLREDGSMMALSDEILISEEQDLHKADIILRDLKKMLLDSKSGIGLSSIKPLFRKKYGYELNHKVLGHRYLASLISTLEGFMLLRKNNGEQMIVCSSHKFQKDGEIVEVDIEAAAAKS